MNRSVSYLDCPALPRVMLCPLRRSLPVLILFSLLTVTVGMLLSLRADQEHLRKVSSGFTGDDAVHFTVPELPADGPAPADLLLPDTLTDCFIVLVWQDIRGVGIRGTPELPPVRQGRFLTPDESAGTEPVAVVGTDRWPEVSGAPEYPVIELLERQVTVCGRMGTEKPSALNRMVMVNLNLLSPQQVAEGRLAVDGPDPEQAFERIREQARLLGVATPERMAPPTNALDILSHQKRWGQAMTVAMVLILTLGTAVLLQEWIRSRLRAVAVLRMVGYRGSRITAALLGAYTGLSLTGIGTALGALHILSRLRLFTVRAEFTRYAVSVAAGTLLVGLVLLLPVVIHVLRVRVVRILR